jgi:dethiobiotin synthetase
MSAKKIIFVTGTDTGVGKTLLTALLLYHLRRHPGRALAMKPFCSGGLGDVRLLQSLQAGELSNAEMNPFYFAEPVAPLAAAKKGQKPVHLSDVTNRINLIWKKCDQLLIEGSGGLMVPLGKGYTVADLIASLNCRVIVVARNRLGTINHTLLTVNALKANGIRAKDLTVVLMAARKPDLSSSSNARIISELVRPVHVMSLPFLGEMPGTAKAIPKIHAKVAKTMARLVGFRK